MIPSVARTIAVIILAMYCSTLPGLGAEPGRIAPGPEKPGLGIGYQAVVLTLPTLGFTDPITMHSLSLRYWGPRRLGGELDLTGATLAGHDKDGNSASATVGAVFGRLLYALQTRESSRFYTGLQIGTPIITTHGKASGGTGSSGGGRGIDDVDYLMLGALIGTEFRLRPCHPVGLNLDVGYQTFNVDAAGYHARLSGLFLSAGVRYHF